MKLKTLNDVHDFLDVVDSCEKDVWLTSPEGDKYNLTSRLSQYAAIGRLLGDRADELEIFASNKGDEARLLNFMNSHRNTCTLMN